MKIELLPHGCRRLVLPTRLDDRGVLTVAEHADLPVAPARTFWISNASRPRGGHAHRTCRQILVAIAGTVRATFHEGNPLHAWTETLGQPWVGLFMPEMTWCDIVLSRDAVLVVFASAAYDESDYIRNESEFVAAVPPG